VAVVPPTRPARQARLARALPSIPARGHPSPAQPDVGPAGVAVAPPRPRSPPRVVPPRSVPPHSAAHSVPRGAAHASFAVRPRRPAAPRHLRLEAPQLRQMRAPSDPVASQRRRPTESTGRPPCLLTSSRAGDGERQGVPPPRRRPAPRRRVLHLQLGVPRPPPGARRRRWGGARARRLGRRSPAADPRARYRRVLRRSRRQPCWHPLQRDWR
jgi:hypothetical protein